MSTEQLLSAMQAAQTVLAREIGQGGTPTTFEDRALPLIKRNLPVIPVPAGTKKAALPNWQDVATTDPAQIALWGREHPDANVACVAKAVPGGRLFLDDDGGIRATYEATGKKLPETLKGLSCSGNYHYTYAHTAASIALQQKLNKAYISETTPDGKGELWSLRMNNAYIIGPGSRAVNHDGVLAEYRTVWPADVAPISDDLLQFLVSRIDGAGKTKERVNASVDGPEIPKGSHDLELFRIACGLRNLGMDFDEIKDHLIQVIEKRCTNHGDDVLDFATNKARSACKYKVGEASIVHYKAGENVVGTAYVGLPPTQGQAPKTETFVSPSNPETPSAASVSEDEIPAFDPSVMTGIYEQMVELATRGTTLAPQFAYVAAKTVIGARMAAGGATFENLDVEPRIYATFIAETGGGKGEAWRRILKIIQPGISTVTHPCKIKIIESADSGAGIRDLFFEEPANLPVLCYVDEVEALGNKGSANKNPDIIDRIFELADNTRISMVKAKGKGGGTRTKNDARLSVVMCGQDGEVFMKAFAGRTKLGIYDRLYPEYGVAVEPGNLPPVDATEAFKLLTKINSLDYSVAMTMTKECQERLDGFWKSQPSEIRKKARWKKNLMLDAYMGAFGLGQKVAELWDAEIAIKIFERQVIIRKVCFAQEAPDKVGVYLSRIKKITESMARRLAKGEPEWAVAKSQRDYETETNAYRDNETHVFMRAFAVHAPIRLRLVHIERANGKKYSKFLPVLSDETYADSQVTDSKSI